MTASSGGVYHQVGDTRSITNRSRVSGRRRRY
jgi:hypothetical protein